MVKFVNRVKLNLTTTGTGTVTFGSVVDGFQSLADASVVDADVVRYTIESGTAYEVGTGTIGLAGGTYTMSRSPSSSSESNNSAINLGSGAVCFLTMLAEDVVQNLADLDNVSSTSPAGGQNLSWDASASSWVPASPSGGITSVGNYAGLPASPSETDLAWVQDQKALYVYDGTEWDRVSTGAQFAPRFTTLPPTTLDLQADGTTSTLTAVAVDDVGFPITYDWDAIDASNNVYSTGTLPDMLTAVSESSGVFTLTPSTNVSHAGSISFRTKASDGVATVVGLTTLVLTFTSAIVIDTGGGIVSNSFSANSSVGLATYVGASSSTSSSYMSYSPLTKLNEGKKYIEIEVISRTTTRTFIGIGDLATAAAGNLGYNDGGNVQSSIYLHGGYIYPAGNVTAGPSSNFIYPGAIIMLAWDTTAQECWWGIDGSWGSTGAPGGTGTAMSLSGVNFTTGLTFIFGHIWTGTSEYQFVSGPSQTLNYSVPTGFSAY